MTKRSNSTLILLLFLLLGLSCSEKEKIEENLSTWDMVRAEINGELAYETVAYVEQYWRVVGSEGFNNSIFRVISILEEAGYVEEENASPDDRLTYRLETRPQQQPTWEPIDATVSIVGQEGNILEFSSNRNMLAINSRSTPEGGVEAEVVRLDTPEQLADLDVKGKIVYTGLHPYQIWNQLMAAEAVGMLRYTQTDYLQQEKNTTSIQFTGMPYWATGNHWAIALSYAANEKLTTAMREGPTRLKVVTETKSYESVEYTLVADVKGSVAPDERLVFSAHVQEPGANDNASGVGALSEIAAAIAKLHKEGKVDLQRTLTMLWGDEISSTRRYIQEDSVRAQNIKWGISLDMVGENTAVTGGSFLIEKMPDPSAIWTRGEDKHTEWGGSKMKLEDMRPHYFNDFMLARFEEQGKFANWEVNSNPFEGGSDHVPFLRGNIPGLLLWHFTDQFYHTDNDRLDKVSAETLKNVSTGALVSAIDLLNADEEAALAVVRLVEEAALTRLQKEKALTEEAIANGTAVEDEDQILAAWKEYYEKTLDSIADLPVSGGTEKLKAAIGEAQGRVGSYE